MLVYLLRKLAYGSLVLVLVVVIISSIIYLAPVDPARLTFGQRSDVATVEAKRSALGLDEPLYRQLGRYLNDISPLSFHEASPANRDKYHYHPLWRSDNGVLVLKKPYLRESYQKGRLVSEMLAEAVPRTFLLALTAIGLALVIGLLLGVLAAWRPNSWFDQLAVSLSVIGISVPSYVSAMVLALVFGYWLHDYTGLEVQGSVYGLDDFGDTRYFWANLLLPALALGVRPVAIITQLTRSAMLDVLSEDFVRTARAKGLSPAVVVIKHALRNALNPVVTAVSGWFAGLLAGAFFVENVFSFNGLGQLTVNALLNYDIPVVLGAVLFTAVIFVVINVLVDVLYGWLDPRVRVGA
ncbi:MAG: ABC transporter permease [Bacteroidota bacterium]